MMKNSTYKTNLKKAHNIINKRINKVMKEKIKKTPCDHVETEIISDYPLTNHKVLGIIGHYINTEDSELFLIDGSSLKPDIVTRIKLDNFKAVEEIAALIENLSTPLSKKLPELLKYNISVTSRKKLGCINYIVTHINPGWHEKDYHN